MSGNGALGWAARMVRIDASYDVSILQSVVHKATVRDLKHYNTVAKRLQQTAEDSFLMYTKLEGDPFRPYTQVITDAAFRNREEAKSQSGQIIRFASTPKPGGVGNIIDYASKKLDRSVRSTYGAELLSHVQGLNLALGVEYLFSEMFHDRPDHLRIDDINWRIPRCPISTYIRINTTTDCKSLWDNIQSNRLPEERNLWPDVTFLKESFKSNLISSHFWTDTEHMVANHLTKANQDPTTIVQLMHGTWITEDQWKKATPLK